MTTYLYRLWDEHDRLLYVGISKSAIHRLHEHLTEQPWAEQVAKQTIERHQTRQEALAAETLAIKSEAPLYNVVHNTPTQWKVAKKSRYSLPAIEISYSDDVTVQMTRHEKWGANPVRTINDRWAHKLLNDVLAAANAMVLSFGKTDPLHDGVDRPRTWERCGLRIFDDLIRSLQYLPYGDSCSKCFGDLATDFVRWPVAVKSDNTYVYQCHVCGAAWTTWYAGGPITLEIKA
jgi:predicted GIY-YIG superfamily endonuclease